MTRAEESDLMTATTEEDSIPEIHWFWIRNQSIQPEGNAITFPDGVFFYGEGILEPGKDANWSLDLVNQWVLVSRYEPRIPVPGRTPHPNSLLDYKDIHHVTSTSVGKDPKVATIPLEMMVDAGEQPRGEILAENPEFWFEKGETCHFVASSAMIICRFMYMLKDGEGRDLVNDRIDADFEEYFTDGGRPVTDGGDPDPERASDRIQDRTEQVIPEAIVGDHEVLNLTTGEIMTFDEAAKQIEEQREEIEQWLEQKRAQAERNTENDTGNNS